MMFVMALVTNYLSIQTECKDYIVDGLWLGSILWCGFSVPLNIVGYLYKRYGLGGAKIITFIDLCTQFTCFLLQSMIIVYFNNL